ncbi:MAG: ABC transporter substrate-binding protein [Archangium sp.]
MRSLHVLGGALVLSLVAVGCSFTTAGNFTECKTDVDCGSGYACSSGYCLPLPTGCKRDEPGGKRKAFEEESRIPLVALFPITGTDGKSDDSQVQSANAIKLAISEANDRLTPDRGFFGLFVCDTGAADAGGILTQAPWFITNLQAPAMFTANSGPTRELAGNAIRRDAGTMLISPNATSPELTVIFQSDPSVWRVAPPDNFQAAVLAKVVASDFPDAGSTRIAIIYPSPDSYGDGFANPLLEQLSMRGYTTSLHPYTEGDPASHITAVTGAVNRSPNASIIIGTPPDCVPIIERAKTFPALTRANGHRWYFTDSGKDVALITPTTATEVDGAFGTAPAQGAGAAFATFRDVFTTRYAIDPNSTNFVSHSYDAAWLVMLAAQYAEGKDPANRSKITGPRVSEGMSKLALSTGPATQLRADKWAELSSALSSGVATNVEGTSGQLDLDLDAGFAMSPYEVWQITDGGITVRRLMSP